MSLFAVTDTETTWENRVMSIGIVIADTDEFKAADARYYTIIPYKDQGGMYSGVLYANGIKPYLEASRQEVMSDIKSFLRSYNVNDIFAYNASFDRNHLTELHGFCWYDIMRLAAYRQYNAKIPKNADTYSTGRLKKGYGVEAVYRMLSGNNGYFEVHNALADAVDELEIMKMMNIPLNHYSVAKII